MDIVDGNQKNKDLLDIINPFDKFVEKSSTAPPPKNKDTRLL